MRTHVASVCGLWAAAMSSAAADSEQRVKHVVVLMLENRPFDHVFGWRSGVNGLTGEEYNDVFLQENDNITKQRVYVDSECPYINSCDPSHGTDATTYKLYGAYQDGNADATNTGFVSYEKANPEYCNVMSGFKPEDLPVINALADEFALMDRFFASHPGPTWPNRMFTLSATSAGSTETFHWYQDVNGVLFPQETIFDQIEEEQLTWRNYYNDTPWELFMQKVADSPDNLLPVKDFFLDAEKGNLPAFSWINPRSGINITSGVGSNDQHPDHDMRAGEQYIKDIYESLRNSPQWNDTLFVITYDEHGGFYDHVSPPQKDIPPPGDGESSYPTTYFKFDRLGVRIPTLLISPWIQKGTVISEPPDKAKPTSSSEFDLTSIIASSRKLLRMDNVGSLTDRDAWAATFDYVVEESGLEEPRTDCPLHLPEAIPPETPNGSNGINNKEHLLPLNDLQRDIAVVHARLAGVPTPCLELQGQHMEYVEKHFQLHASRTRHFQKVQDDIAKGTHAYSVVTMAKKLYGSLDTYKWDVNGIPHGGIPEYENNSMPFVTLSTPDLMVEVEVGGDTIEVPFCLDAGSGRQGTVLAVAPCLPSQDPSINRVRSQHFVLFPDATLRYYDEKLAAAPDLFLCVTTRGPRETDPVTLVTTLEPCTLTDAPGATTPEVKQAWAFHGAAPGVDYAGQFMYGDGSNALGVIAN